MSEEQQPYDAGPGHPSVTFKTIAAAMSKAEAERARMVDLEGEVQNFKWAIDRANEIIEAERAIIDALERRLVDVTSRKLALQVAHGDLPPEQFERRRKIEVDAIRNLVGGLRVSV